MRTRRSIVYFLLVALSVVVVSLLLRSRTSVAADEKPRSSPEQPLEVSIIQLIACPNDFDGEYVRVEGFYHTEFEGTAIYLHQEDYEKSLSKNGLWVNRVSREVDLKYVLIEGRFNATRKGHFGGWSGEIDEVKRLDRLPSKAEFSAR
jgi:hypothetical protein